MAIAANLEETERIFSFFDKVYLESDPQYDYVYNAENYEQAEKYYYGENENTKSFKERIDCVYSKELPKQKYNIKKNESIFYFFLFFLGFFIFIFYFNTFTLQHGHLPFTLRELIIQFA